jgi:hypothetical protein
VDIAEVKQTVLKHVNEKNKSSPVALPTFLNLLNLKVKLKVNWRFDPCPKVYLVNCKISLPKFSQGE